MFKVLMVCTGNICRSPTAEAILRHHLRAAGLEDAVLVDSAGLENWNVGSGPTPLAASLGEAAGYDFSGLVARHFGDQDFADFDLILGMDQGHLKRLTARAPQGCRAELAFLRHFAEAAPQEIEDPYGGDEADYSRSLALIEGSMPGLLSAIKSKLSTKGYSASTR